MLKKTIKYTDYNGVEREENHWFNLTEAEIVEMEMGETGGYAEMLQEMVKANDVPKLMKVFKKFIFKAYGLKNPDGIHFDKSEEISRAFSHTEAYSVLFMELVTDAQKAADFVNAIIPKARKVDNSTHPAIQNNHKKTN